MQILPTLMVTAVVGLQAAAPAAPFTTSESLLVVAVLDGDTIQVARLGRVRLLGIDAPEIGRGFDTAAPFAREARDRLTELLLRRWVHLESDGLHIDAYKRRLAYVLRDDGMFVNGVVVREGLARVTARVPLRRLDELRRAEVEAQRARRGIWGGAAQLQDRRGILQQPVAKRRRRAALRRAQGVGDDRMPLCVSPRPPVRPRHDFARRRGEKSNQP